MIRMDISAGLWHAFWMLPSNAAEPWPVSGELDIMEYVGNKPNEMFQTIHFADRFGNHQFIGEIFPFLTATGWHLYALEWDENKIVWYIDEEETYRIERTNDAVAETCPYDAKFHILLNTAVGGTLGGDVDDNALATPNFMEVDYVRVYQSQ